MFRALICRSSGFCYYVVELPHWLISFLVCCVLELGCGSARVVSVLPAEALLKMGILMPETCWISKKKNENSKWHLIGFLFFTLFINAQLFMFHRTFISCLLKFRFRYVVTLISVWWMGCRRNGGIEGEGCVSEMWVLFRQGSPKQVIMNNEPQAIPLCQPTARLSSPQVVQKLWLRLAVWRLNTTQLNTRRKGDNAVREAEEQVGQKNCSKSVGTWNELFATSI